jgi:hypothetical protein
MEKGDKPKKSKIASISKKPKAKPKVSPKAKPKKQKKERKIDSSIKQSVKVIVGSGSGAEPKRKEISKQTTYITLDRPYQLSQEDEDKLSITKFIPSVKKEPTATLNTVVSNPLNEIPKANSQDIEIASKASVKRLDEATLPFALQSTAEPLVSTAEPLVSTAEPLVKEIAKKKRKKVVGKIPVSQRMTEAQAGYMSFPSSEDDSAEEIRRQEKQAIRFLEKYQKPFDFEEMNTNQLEGEMTPVRIEEGFEEVQEKRRVGRPKKYTSEEAKIIKNIQTKESNDRRALLKKQQKSAELEMEYQQFLENEAFQEESISSNFLSKSVDELGEQNNFSAIQSNQGPNDGGGDDILFE